MGRVDCVALAALVLAIGGNIGRTDFVSDGSVNVEETTSIAVVVVVVIVIAIAIVVVVLEIGGIIIIIDC